MSYLVLARKWRPRNFSELVGQEHVVRALTNALDSGRVHHAFLFTGTRGVGKTTIARIFAKSLNCLQGVGANPCGECEICQAVDQGRFVDLLEIDAASNTGVDDVREVIENAQYSPTRGRYKVYLIDEVHMLSKSAFNALLKTLEEPPEHVKFLLATTDPQKMPVTVLSRCLQFNLRRLSEAQIAGQMRYILDQEQVEAEDTALAELARAADGSLRDGLSLLDQVLAFGGGRVDAADVRSMLGSVDRSQIQAVLDALAVGDGARLMQVAEAIAGFSPDFAGVLDALAYALHRVQLQQLVPGVQLDADGVDVESLAAMLSPEVVQLWYQMAVLGRRDVDLAPNARVGFEMTLLRMLAFQPTNAPDVALSPGTTTAVAGTPSGQRAAPAAPSAPIPPPAAMSAPFAPAPAPVPARVPPANAAVSATAPRPERSQSPGDDRMAVAGRDPVAIIDNESWLRALERCDISGPVRELGANLQFVGIENGRTQVFLPHSHDYLRGAQPEQRLCEALAAVSSAPVQLEFVSAPANDKTETFADRTRREAQLREEAAQQAFANEPFVSQLVAEGATIRPDSVRPRESS